jgi:predicted DNA binding CopG/RHH family protein
MMTTQNIHYRIKKENYVRLTKAAAKRGLPACQLLNELIEKNIRLRTKKK